MPQRWKPLPHVRCRALFFQVFCLFRSLTLMQSSGQYSWENSVCFPSNMFLSFTWGREHLFSYIFFFYFMGCFICASTELNLPQSTELPAQLLRWRRRAGRTEYFIIFIPVIQDQSFSTNFLLLHWVFCFLAGDEVLVTCCQWDLAVLMLRL